VLALTHYVDDSGCDEYSNVAVIGGPVFLQKSFHSFHYEWGRLADVHGVQLPIHMRDFARPHGRLAGIGDEQRRFLFRDLVTLINTEKAWSLTVTIANDEFRNSFAPEIFRHHVSPDAMAFYWCLLLNHIVVKQHKTRLEKMSYYVANSSRNTQLLDAYHFWKSYEDRMGEHHTGACGFDDAKQVNALQAADLVAWSNHRKDAGLPFNHGFEPLVLLTRSVGSDVKPIIHFHYPVKATTIAKLAAILGNPVRAKARRQSLLGLLPTKWQIPDSD
jgi:hypothetical protein